MSSGASQGNFHVRYSVAIYANLHHEEITSENREREDTIGHNPWQSAPGHDHNPASGFAVSVVKHKPGGLGGISNVRY